MNPTLISGFEDVINHIKQLEQRVMGLEEENKKLKAENKEYEFESNESGVKEQKLYGQLFQFQAENEKLKEENERLKEQIDEQYEFSYFKRVKELEQENKKLEAKILLLQSSEEGLEKKLDTGGWSPTSSPEPKQ
jgi:chromosome segregation ATPase